MKIPTKIYCYGNKKKKQVWHISDSPLDATKARELVYELPNAFIDYQFYGKHYYTWSHGSDIPRWEMGFKNKEGVTFRIHDEERLINKFLANGYCIKKVLKPFVFKYSKKHPGDLIMGFPKATDEIVNNELLYEGKILKGGNNYSMKTFEMWVNSLEDIKVEGCSLASYASGEVIIHPRCKEFDEYDRHVCKQSRVSIDAPKCFKEIAPCIINGKLVAKADIDKHYNSLSEKQKLKFDAIKKRVSVFPTTYSFDGYISDSPFKKFHDYLKIKNKEILESLKIAS